MLCVLFFDCLFSLLFPAPVFVRDFAYICHTLHCIIYHVSINKSSKNERLSVAFIDILYDPAVPVWPQLYLQ